MRDHWPGLLDFNNVKSPRENVKMTVTVLQIGAQPFVILRIATDGFPLFLPELVKILTNPPLPALSMKLFPYR